MVNNSDAEFRDLIDSLLEHLIWAKKNHVVSLPNAKQPEFARLGTNEVKVQKNKELKSTSSIDSLLCNTEKDSAQKLEILRTEIIGNCQDCKLCEHRTQIVFGNGDPSAKLVFVGEGPGAEEDRLGEPFVGRSGKLLTKMIEAMGLSRDRVYICNVVKCRPPNNRDPEPEEVSSCLPLLKAQLNIIKPRVIVTLGRYACQTLLSDNTPIGQLRGKWSQYEGIDLMPTFHPAFLLRNPSKKKEVWQDLQNVMSRLEI